MAVWYLGKLAAKHGLRVIDPAPNGAKITH
jgi:hypothetical protein